jgi:hypothetical protein
MLSECIDIADPYCPPAICASTKIEIANGLDKVEGNFYFSRDTLVRADSHRPSRKNPKFFVGDSIY